MTIINLIKNGDKITIERGEEQISITLKDNVLESKELFEKIFELEGLDKEFELKEVNKLELSEGKLSAYYNDVKKILTDIISEIDKL